MKKYFILLLIFRIIPLQYCFSQNPDPNILKSNMREKVFKIDEGDINNVYVNFDKDIFINLGHDIQDKSYIPEIEDAKFDLSVYQGSFLNKKSTEYLLFIRLAEGAKCSFFSHAANFGNTTFIIIFDKYYSQISKIYLFDSETNIVEITDINENGINEVILESSYGMMGCFQKWYEIYEKDFDKCLLRIDYFHSCLNSGNKGENIMLNSNYKIIKNKIIFDSVLDYYLCLGNLDEDNDPTNLYMKTEFKKDEYEYRNGSFFHIKDTNNVNWNDDRLEF